MNDKWLYYFCRMGDHYAFISYDDGVSETINQVAPAQLLRLRLRFKNPRENGFPSSEEHPVLNALEEELQALAREHRALFVGEFSVAGARQFHVYTSDSQEAWSPRLQALGQRHGYDLEFSVKADENRDGYWKDLYPTEEDRHMIEDLRVIAGLREEGDDTDAQRHVDHWAYFSSDSAAARFCQWARESGYGLEASGKDEDGRYPVRVFHEASMHWQDITSHTIKVRRKAVELGGDYDGWETEVFKA
jgi:hypothetical protein